MSGIDDLMLEVTPELLLRGYACGIFPMAESADDPGLFWVEPALRGVLPLDDFHCPRSLAKRMRKDDFEIKTDTAFGDVVDLCAESVENRPDTWINDRIRALYSGLFEMGHAHSVEVYFDSELQGGLYGVDLGGAFFGESMFSRRTDASKIALVHLVERLRVGGYVLLDTQFLTDHLARFGTVEIARPEYLRRLETAVEVQADFNALDNANRPVV